MAKVKGTYVTNLSGRVGDVVYRNVQGENIASQRPASVLNPKTGDQAIQRCLFNTCIVADSILYDVTDHSTQNLSGKRKNLSAFMSENLKALRSQLSLTEKYYLPKGGKGITYFPFLVSKGNILTLECVAVNDSLSRYDENTLICAFPSTIGTNMADFVDNYKDCTFTAIAIWNSGKGEDEFGNAFPIGYNFSYVQWKWLSNNLAGGTFSELESYDMVEIIGGSPKDFYYADDVTSESVFGSSYSTGIYYKDKSQAMISYAIILSRKTDNGWEYSTSYMTPVKSNTIDDDYTLTLKLAALSMGVSDDYLLNNPSASVDGELVFG